MTRSRMTGKVRSGVTVMVSVGSKVDIRVMHISPGLPLTSALHEPHLPALQFQRTARSGAWVACRRWTMSRTTSPSLTSTVKSSSAPPVSSPRQTRKLASYPIRQAPRVVEVLGQLVAFEQRQQVRAHRGQWLLDDLDAVAIAASQPADHVRPDATSRSIAGKSSRVCPPRDSSRVRAARAMHSETTSMLSRSRARCQPGLNCRCPSHADLRRSRLEVGEPIERAPASRLRSG